MSSRRQNLLLFLKAGYHVEMRCFFLLFLASASSCLCRLFLLSAQGNSLETREAKHHRIGRLSKPIHMLLLLFLFALIYYVSALKVQVLNVAIAPVMCGKM